MGRSRTGRFAAPKLAVAIAAALSLGGCAGAQMTTGAAPPEGLGEARWVETTPTVRTLLVAPTRLGDVARPGEDAATLAIGSFFARYDSPRGPVDQLALMVVLEGKTAAHILDSGLSLMLEIDGHFFQGQPGLGNNSVSWDPANEGRATLAIPISRELLVALASADVVRGRVGAYATFDFPTAKRSRLGDVLRGLPADYRANPVAASLRAQGALAPAP